MVNGTGRRGDTVTRARYGDRVGREKLPWRVVARAPYNRGLRSSVFQRDCRVPSEAGQLCPLHG